MRGRLLCCAGLIAAGAAGVSGCASVTPGSGSAVDLRRSEAATFPSVSNRPGAPSPSDTPRSDAPATPAGSTPANPASTAPPPGICANGKCRQVGSAALDDDYGVTVYTAPSPSGAVAATVTELTLGEVPVYWHVTDDASPSELSCSAAPRPNCGLTVFVGAHASEAFGLVRIGQGLTAFDQVDVNTPTAKVGDLNGDGWVDVAAIQNTYQPSYATGKVYWQTSTSDGTRFTSTGCTLPTHEPPPAPTAPLTGGCPRA